jgi:hypothetical protein
MGRFYLHNLWKNKQNQPTKRPNTTNKINNFKYNHLIPQQDQTINKPNYTQEDLKKQNQYLPNINPHNQITRQNSNDSQQSISINQPDNQISKLLLTYIQIRTTIEST